MNDLWDTTSTNVNRSKFYGLAFWSPLFKYICKNHFCRFMVIDYNISNSDNKAAHFNREIEILDSVLWLWFHSYISYDERSWHALDFPSTSMSSLDFLALNSGIIKGCIFYCNYLSRTLYLEKPCLIFRNQRWWWLSWQCTDFFRSKWISVLRDWTWNFFCMKCPYIATCNISIPKFHILRI